MDNSQDMIDVFLNKVKDYSIDYLDNKIKIYGISQNPDTNDYMMVLGDHYGKDGYTTVYSAVWKSGPLCYNLHDKREYARDSNKSVALKYLNDSEQLVNNLFDKVKKYSIKIDGKGGFASVYSAIWKDGPLFHKRKKDKLSRAPDKKVALKCLCNSQFLTDEFLNKVKRYAINSVDNSGKILKVYGLTQNPNTKEYVLVLQYAEDVGLYGDAGNTDEIKIYGVMPYVAPEVLRGKSHIQQSDIYSFDDDEIDNEIEDQFTEAETYRKSNKFIQSNIHHQAIYMSRLLNSHVKDLNKHLNDE
ncbi:unnamed protein product [Rhizophagus irregularis]|uniref:Protein kinase domain-containing protein n=1 Tax=Rhizophagus irregularis TaxID=588596 RepID=A0A915Z5Z8_9GLOM|nr:unnamed protein product [Rhizophagus irregularis]